MKNLILTLFIFTVISPYSLGQNIDFILKKSPTQYLSVFDTTTTKKNQKLIHLKHSSSKIENPKTLLSLKNEVIYSIQLIYTEPDKNNFNQENLNRKRLNELKKIAPELIENSLISWEFIEQRNQRQQNNKKLFHG